MTQISAGLAAALIGAVLIYGAVRRIDCYQAFAEGAKQGLQACMGLLPTLCAMLIAVALMQAGGVFDFLSRVLSPAAEKLGLPAALLPLLLARPFSGSAAMGLLLGLMTTHGADSTVGLAGCIMLCAGETVVYTLGLYFSAAGVKKWRSTLFLCLLGNVVGAIMAIMLT
ncbi:MAG: hypothetical protein IJP30_00650 [Clostridia bacterium]|nr:hypothetical protein [Clostridia bacterium]